MNFQLPLVNESNWQSWEFKDDYAVRYFVHPKGFYYVSGSKIKDYRNRYGTQ
jgi:hypothetical protein